MANIQFNWIYYVASSPDLIAANILSKDAAISHYSAYGIGENRSTQIRSTGKNLIFQLHFGLANQLYGLFNAIFLAHYSGRNAICRFFSLQFDNQEMCALSKIIDIPHLNKLLRELGLRTTLIDYFGNFITARVINPEEYRKLEFNKALQSFSILRDIIKYPTEDIDIIFPCNYPLYDCYPDEVDRRRISTLLSRFQFTPIFYEIRDFCITTLNLKNFTAVHLRLEDDILPFRSTEEIEENKMKYLTEMKKCESNFYLATSLGKSVQQNNSFLQLLEREFPGRCKYWTADYTWRSKYSDILKGREIDAIVDYLVCCSADHFIGYRTSTFSETIYVARQERGLSVKYIN